MCLASSWKTEQQVSGEVCEGAGRYRAQVAAGGQHQDTRQLRGERSVTLGSGASEPRLVCWLPNALKQQQAWKGSFCSVDHVIPSGLDLSCVHPLGPCSPRLPSLPVPSPFTIPPPLSLSAPTLSQHPPSLAHLKLAGVGGWGGRISAASSLPSALAADSHAIPGLVPSPSWCLQHPARAQ